MRYSAILRPSYAQACVVAATICACQATASYAGIMTLTGNVPGFTITTFASGIGAAGNDIVHGQGAMGIAFDPQGRVWVSQFGDGYAYVFPNDHTVPNDTVGQNAQNQPTVLKSQSYGTLALMGLADLDGHMYVASNAANNIGEFTTPSNVITHQQKLPFPFAQSIVASNVHDTVYLDIGPGSGTLPVVVELNGSGLQGSPVVSHNIFYDGTSNVRASCMALSSDQNTLYVLWNNDPSGVGEQIDEYSLTARDVNGNPTFLKTFMTVASGIDGLVAGTGKFEGTLFADTGDGNLFLLDPNDVFSNQQLLLLGSGGSNGGYMATDPWDGSLFIGQSDRVLRVTAPAGGGFASTAVTLTPEPASLGLLGLGALGLLGRRRKA